VLVVLDTRHVHWSAHNTRSRECVPRHVRNGTQGHGGKEARLRRGAAHGAAERKCRGDEAPGRSVGRWGAWALRRRGDRAP